MGRESRKSAASSNTMNERCGPEHGPPRRDSAWYLKSPSDAVGVAQDEHRLGRRTRQIFGSKSKDQCLTRSSDAANNSMPFSQAARKLLLMHVHHCERPV